MCKLNILVHLKYKWLNVLLSYNVRLVTRDSLKYIKHNPM